MKRLSLILIIGLVLGLVAFAVPNPSSREEDPGSSFMNTSESSSNWLPGAIDQNPGIGSGGYNANPERDQVSSGSYLQPIAQDVGPSILATEDTAPDPHVYNNQ
jgi:hypothetical protein